jgi:hypothetical protein
MTGSILNILHTHKIEYKAIHIQTEFSNKINFILTTRVIFKDHSDPSIDKHLRK